MITVNLPYYLTTLYPVIDWYSFEGGWEYENIIVLNNNYTLPSKEKCLQGIDELKIKLKINDCKNQAKRLLSESDWSELPSVIEGLENANEWKSYRIEIRKYIINPIENPIFPNKPETQWKDI